MTIKYDYNLSVLYNEDDISFYLLGAFITDGCVYKNNGNTYACQLSSCDKDWLETIKKILGKNLNIHQFKENYWGIRITRNEIAQWFIKHGCIPQKTYSITLPQIPEKFFSDFLRGCIDGDGSIGTYVSKKQTTRSCTLISASKIFLEKIQEKLNKINIYSSLINRGKQNSKLHGKIIIANTNSYCLKWTGKNCLKLLEYCYYPNHKLSLNRKFLKAKEIINYYNSSAVNHNLRKKHKLNTNCKISWPSDEELLFLINKSNIEKVALTLGVHGTAIRNRLKNRNIYDKVIKYQKIILPDNETLIQLLTEYSRLQLSKKLNIGYKTFLKKLKERNL